MWPLAYHPVLFEKLKELFMYIITYLCTHGLWVDNRNGNEGGKNGKKWNGNEIGKKGSLSSFAWWPVILWYQT